MVLTNLLFAIVIVFQKTCHAQLDPPARLQLLSVTGYIKRHSCSYDTLNPGLVVCILAVLQYLLMKQVRMG